MAKNHNTFNKRRREMEKKDRADEKRQRKQQRRDQEVPAPVGPVFVVQPRLDDE